MNQILGIANMDGRVRTWRAAMHALAFFSVLLFGNTSIQAATTEAKANAVVPASAASAPSVPVEAADAKHVVNLAPVVAVTETDPSWQTIVLHRNGASGSQVAVTVGIPFPPGALRDAQRVHIVDEQGHDIPAHIEPSLTWHFRDGSIRAVRAQFRTSLQDDERALHFTIGGPNHNIVAGWPYADGLVAGPEGEKVPGVLATLDPRWMSASLIAGPQLPALSMKAYDRFYATQFDWARALPRDNLPAWLFDRPTTLFQQYVRTGRVEYLAAATSSYRYYMDHIRRQGAPGWPLCGGGFDLDGKVCDPKYVYVEPILLALGLTGDDSEHDSLLIQKMIGAWDTGGWNFPAGPYNRPEQRFTEREAGLGLLATVSAYEITGDKRYLGRIDQRLTWLYQHQQNNPDGLGNDGSWRNSWQVHEGAGYNAATDIRGSSPWMTENIVDGLWHAWLVTRDERIPRMITDFGRYMEHYGWIDLDALTGRTTWRNPCSGSNGQISWYWSSAHADEATLERVQNSEGWYSDAHNVEMMLPVAAARFFETDLTQRKALDRRLSALQSSYNMACAANSKTPRRFNWNNRGVGVVQWFMHRFERGED